jgi:hypothetical protein
MKKRRKQRADKGKPRKSRKTLPIATLDNVQSKSDTLKTETRDNIPIDKDLTFEDLPKDRQEKINKVIEWRKNLNLPDDSEDRKRRAVEYFKFEKGRKCLKTKP